MMSNKLILSVILYLLNEARVTALAFAKKQLKGGEGGSENKIQLNLLCIVYLEEMTAKTGMLVILGLCLFSSMVCNLKLLKL